MAQGTEEKLKNSGPNWSHKISALQKLQKPFANQRNQLFNVFTLRLQGPLLREFSQLSEGFTIVWYKNVYSLTNVINQSLFN